MEYVPGGNLYRMLCQKGKLREVEARWLFQQLIIALEFIHRRVRFLLEMVSHTALTHH